MPPTIQALLAARLDRLPLAGARVRSAPPSVVGQEFWARRGRGAAAGAGPARTAPGTARGPGAQAADRRPRAVDARGRERAFAFRHVLIRDAAYESLTKERPGRAARALRRLAGGAPPRAHDRARGDPRIPPRAGLRLSRGAGRGPTSARSRSHSGRAAQARLRRAARRARARGHRRRGLLARAGALLRRRRAERARACCR